MQLANLIWVLQGSESVKTENSGLRPAIQSYAVRFLEYDCTISTHLVLAEAPATPERVVDAAKLENYGESELSEVRTLFFFLELVK